MGGGVTTSGGTSGKIAKFTGSQVIGDSLLSESGSTVTAAGNLNLTTGNTFQVNGTQISSANLSNDSNLAKLDATQTFTGATNTFKNGTNSTSAFLIQNTAGRNLLNVDTTNSKFTFGNITSTTGQGIAGTLLLADGTNDNFGATLNTTTLTASRTISLPDEAGTICIRSSSNCGFAASSGSTSYIQNQSSSDQSADFRITGSGRASTSLLTPLLDTATATGLAIGTTNATSISLNQNTSIASGKTFTANGASLFQDSADVATAFQIQSSVGTPLFVADASNSRIYVGNPTADSVGTLLVLDTKNVSGDPTGVNGGMYYNSNANKFRCYQNSGWTDCISNTSITLQNAYDNSSSPATITTSDGKNLVFTLADTTTDPNLIVNLQCTTSCSTNGRFVIQGNTATDVFHITPTGAIALQNNTNSNAAFQILNATGSSTPLSVDTTNGRVAIGTSTSTAGSTLLVNGSTQLTGTTASTFTTPLGASITARFLIDALDPGAFNQVIALGLTSSAASTARGIMVADARSSTSNNPAIAVLSPDENNLFGLVWDGSNTTAKLKATDQNVNDTAGINVSIVAGKAKGTAAGGTASLLGGSGGASGGAGGGATIQGGNAAAGNNNGGDVTIQGGTPAGTGTGGSVIVKPQTDSSTAFMIQNAAGSRLAVVDSTNTISAVRNGGAEIAFGSEWATYGTGVTVSRTTSLAWSGQASVSVVTTGSANSGVKQNLGAALNANDFYSVSFYAEVSATPFTDIAVVYSRDGTAGTEVACTSYNTQTLSAQGWTRVTCNFSTPVTAGNSSAYVAIKQTAGASRTFYVDGLNLTQSRVAPDTYGAGSLSLDTRITSALMLQNATNSTSALLLEDIFGAAILRVDTVNRYVQIGDSVVDGYESDLVLDHESVEDTPTVDGAMYYNSDSKSFRCTMSGAWRSCVGGTIFANTSVPAAVANTASDTNFATSYTIPANDCQPGRTYKIVAQGVWSDTGTPSFLLRVKIGSTTINSGPNQAAPTTGSANQNWRLEYQIICITAGSSGTVEGQGQMTLFSDSTTMVGRALTSTSTVTVDTTASHALQISAQWGAASSSNTVTMRQFIVDAGGP